MTVTHATISPASFGRANSSHSPADCELRARSYGIAQSNRTAHFSERRLAADETVPSILSSTEQGRSFYSEQRGVPCRCQACGVATSGSVGRSHCGQSLACALSDRRLEALNWRNFTTAHWRKFPRGAFPQRVDRRDAGGFERICSGILEKLGITVKRPETWPHEAKFSTIHWKAQGYYNYCPRDVLLVIGDQIIETPNVIRSRAQETFSYRALLMDYMKSGRSGTAPPSPCFWTRCLRLT